MRKVFLTGHVARLCNVSNHTVHRWFDSGLLCGYRIPGSNDRRIPREQLVRFLKEHGMPLGELEEDGWHKILVIGAEKLLVDRMQELLGDGFLVEAADSGFGAGLLARECRPGTFVIDLALGRGESIRIARSIRHSPDYVATPVVALANEDEAAPEKLVEHGFSETFKKPFDIALLGERVRGLACVAGRD